MLPTYGYSRMYSGVSLDSFVKYMTVQELTRAGLQALGPSVARMAGPGARLTPLPTLQLSGAASHQSHSSACWY